MIIPNLNFFNNATDHFHTPSQHLNGQQMMQNINICTYSLTKIQKSQKALWVAAIIVANVAAAKTVSWKSN